MTKEEKAKLQDNLLLKFKGNRSFSAEAIHKKEFYESINEDFFVVENNLNFLIGDGMVEKYYLLMEGDFYKLTSKGFAVMTDLENLGYVHRHANELVRTKWEYGAFKYARLSFWIAVLAALLTVVGYFIKNSN